MIQSGLKDAKAWKKELVSSRSAIKEESKKGILNLRNPSRERGKKEKQILLVVYQGIGLYGSQRKERGG